MSLADTRYSTDEQSQSSIDGQINACQRFLTANLPRGCTLEKVNVEIIREPEISGEIADRPGINQVWAGIKARRWDVILAEESSRLYQQMTFAAQFFDTAVDGGIRMICPTDFIDRERELKLVRSRLEGLSSLESQQADLPSPEEHLGYLESLRADLIAGDRRAPVILRRLLDGPIRAVPYQQFGTDKVVLRAEFEVTLTSGLPAVIGESIRQDGVVAVDGLTLVRRPVVVDLFEPSKVPQHAVEAYDLKETGMSLSKIGAALGISKRLADFAARLGGSMATHGLADPFVRLAERPEKVSRWNRER